MGRIRIAACQIDTVVGDLEGNVERVLESLTEAERSGVDLAAFPELAVTGYPPEDLLGRPAFVLDSERAFARIAAASGDCAAVVGHVARDDAGRLVNAASICAQGGVRATYVKELLPNYGVFDEQRWFAPGPGAPAPCVVAGIPVGITICEDMWVEGGPMLSQARAGARILVNLNASPYSRDRCDERLVVLRDRVSETKCPIVYVNQVGGQDELVFDGASLVMDADGTVVASAGQFVEEVQVADVLIADGPETSGRGGLDGGASRAPEGHSRITVTEGPSRAAGMPLNHPVARMLEPEAEVYGALVLGTRDYLAKNGFTDAVIGLSGGIDSSLVAAVAVDAVGSEHVHGVTMPSRYSSDGSVTDAEALAGNLGIELTAVHIEPAHRAFATMLASLVGGEPTGLTDENLQSRIRGVVLMALSNAKGWIVLTTGNKSEMASGYSTLYGDSAGGFAVIKDVPKTLVYDLCRYRNRQATTPIIPGSVLGKPPSAELRPGQRDDESLPPYPELDPVIAGYVEEDRSPDDLIAEGHDPDVVARVVELVDRAEYKRRQMPPGVRISRKAFGKDRRMPITSRYRSTPLPEPQRPTGETFVV
ncbi:MAG: NAD+ synthase [Acidimicrobiales bacterium]